VAFVGHGEFPQLMVQFWLSSYFSGVEDLLRFYLMSSNFLL
jgi:hypothetical protein